MDGSEAIVRENYINAEIEYGSTSRRLIANIIDMVVLAFVTSPLHSMLNGSDIEGVPLFVLTACLSLLVPAYSIIGHGKWGKTIGKMVVGLKVIDKSGNKEVQYRQAILREIIPILVWLPFLFGGLLRDVLDMGVFQDVFFYTKFNGIFGLAWPASEIATMMTNVRRRAIHDFIAGTIVVRD